MYKSFIGRNKGSKPIFFRKLKYFSCQNIGEYLLVYLLLAGIFSPVFFHQCWEEMGNWKCVCENTHSMVLFLAAKDNSPIK